MNDANIMVVSERIVLTLQVTEFKEIQVILRKMKNEGWSIDKFPHFHFGKWRAVLSRQTQPQLLRVTA